MNDSVFGNTTENVMNHRDIKLVATNERRLNLVSRPNYHTSKCFSENLLETELRKTEVKMDKPIYLGQSILGISKIAMQNNWYDYIKNNV